MITYLNNYTMYAVINYNSKLLHLRFRGELFTFDLTKGDVGDYWHGFEIEDGTEFDINFFQESADDKPYINIWNTQYDIDDDAFYTCDCIEDFAPAQLIGDANTYFNNQIK